jgi:hypothetical protein
MKMFFYPLTCGLLISGMALFSTTYAEDEINNNEETPQEEGKRIEDPKIVDDENKTDDAPLPEEEAEKDKVNKDETGKSLADLAEEDVRKILKEYGIDDPDPELVRALTEAVLSDPRMPHFQSTIEEILGQHFGYYSPEMLQSFTDLQQGYLNKVNGISPMSIWPEEWTGLPTTPPSSAPWLPD